jgi:TP53 regulating kinase-like protein
MRLIGREIGKLHLADIVHGDLTTSNMILRDRAEGAEPELVRYICPSSDRTSMNAY